MYRVNKDVYKNCPNLFLSELHQICIKMANNWHRWMIELCDVHSFSTSPNLCQSTTV